MRPFLCAVLVTAAPLLAQVTINGLPTREFGQPTLAIPLNSVAPNLVEGRELYNPSAVAFDTSVNPPHVYIVDTGNNRVLGWSNATNVTQGNFADLVIGQPNLYSTLPAGPGTSASTGLNAPTGIAVDASGNVYVADSGNNRILRFKTPFLEPAGDLPVDLVIGQKTSSSGNSANQGGLSSTSLNLAVAPGGQLLAAGLAVDGQGNLWVADAGNNRVLGFPPAMLAANTSQPAAGIVLGQTSFTSSSLPGSEIQTNLSFLLYPTSVAADSQGNLYVTDQAGRAIQYLAPIVSGETGSKVLGIPPTPTTQGQTVAYPTASTLGSLNSSGNVTGSPQGVFVLNGASGASATVFVCDSPQNRVVSYSSLTVPASANSPLQSGVTGQLSFTSGKANQGQVNPSNQTFSYPVAGAINPGNGEMWIVDQANNRVVAFQSQGGGVYSTASRVIGQTGFNYGTANLIVGSELWISVNPNTPYGGGIAIDSSATPPHLYIADTYNNRILAFNNAYNVGVGSSGVLAQTADLVIGQADLFHSTINSPNGVAGQPSATGLYLPVGVAVDSSGNLWVADSGNGRAVRFPAPFAQPTGSGSVPTATVVLGQPDLFTFNQGVSQYSMTEPYGLAIFADSGPLGSGSLAVSDPAANRILVFNRPSGGDFTSGAAAQFVVGQPSFTQFASGNSTSQFNSPRHIAVDSSDRLYVCDYSNNRLIVFSKPTENNPAATLAVSISQPVGVIVSFLTGQSWVTSANSNDVVYQLPVFETLETTDQPTQEISSYYPLAVALDPFDNVIVADSANRVTFYFGQLYSRNTASYAAGVSSSSFSSTAGPTPGMLTWVGRYGSAFNFTPSYGTGPAANMNPPWPPSYNGVQVTVNGTPAPIFRIDPAEVLFEIPNLAPQSGPADFLVSNPTTGQVYAAATLTMQQASPGIYTLNSEGTGPAVANVTDSHGNYLGSPPYVNSSSNPVPVGGYIGLWLTGSGYVSGLPADGTAPGACGCGPQGNVSVVINGTYSTSIYQGISSQFPGVWQVNAQVPAGTPSGAQTVIVILDDHNSNIGGTNATGGAGPDILLQAAGASGPGAGLITTIYVQ
jgi:uncharacterized protein (TIGR03437 family)